MKRFNQLLICTVVVFLSLPSLGQEKATIRLDLTYHQQNNGLPSLWAQVRTRIDRRYEPVENIMVNFYHTEIDRANLLGSAETNADGISILQLEDQFREQWDTAKVIAFYAAVKDNPDYDDKDDDIEITKAEIEVELLEGETNEVKVSINKYSDEGQIPAEEVQVKLQVTRTFSTLPIGNGFETDEEGEFTAEFPTDIPGGSDGTLTIIVFVEDDSDLGYLRFEKEAPWGTMVKNDNDEFYSRSLWAARDKAPIWLLVFPNLIILGIWGTMIYLVWLIFRINRIGKPS